MVRNVVRMQTRETPGAEGRSLLELIRASGDAHLGQTLVRLAEQAAAEHRAQLERAVVDGEGDGQDEEARR